MGCVAPEGDSVTASSLKRSDLQDVYWHDCDRCGCAVVFGLRYGGKQWQRLETGPDGGSPGETSYQKHVCPASEVAA